MKPLVLSILLILMMARFGFSDNIKSPNVSGQFYSADAKELAHDVDTYINSASAELPAEQVTMIIAPHAGYVYSGPVAGYSFKNVARKKIKTVVILAPSHYYGFDGASVWPEGGFKTPLGTVAVDENFSKALIAEDPRFSFLAQAYDREHSLEVELPFLQQTYSDFKIVPVILGQMSFEACQKLAQALNKLIAQRDDVLVVVSSDMSHYHDGATAKAMDLSTLETIKNLDAQELYQQCRRGKQEMCGFVPVTTALLLAQAQNWQSKILKYANSGDVTGDYSRVVGYGAVAFVKNQGAAVNAKLSEKKDKILTTEQKRYLLELTRKTIEAFVREQKELNVQPQDPRLTAPEGAFVTIHKNGNLRGCIGHIVTKEPLYKTVRDMAIAAASEDPRFAPVRSDELKDLDLEISVLSQPWPITNVSEIQMGVHGVIVSRGGRQGVFLPQVATETGWSREEFLSQLCSQKAGLPADCWKDPATKIVIFTADVFGEKDFKE